MILKRMAILVLLDFLVKHIDEDSALFLLSIADQFNAGALRVNMLILL